ncbi:hypothetical protein C2U72_04730 [Prosthecomicrobium hirschii]|uniref:tetratricopeptide repeat protein n=1 Tax=Prosthecodimorpha hirschii TaxID=665126 RepID=UPI0011279381|nr:hypothetical protein [Prosthecomicrobium hirschii]TPQ52114.1 hypothetical protein C2U72_04730 [Prosthecomicrobium hirschii]
MIRLAVAILALAAALAVAAIADGRAALGRLLMAAGWPEPAVGLFDRPEAIGTALYRAGRYGEAADAFRRAGAAFAFDRGDALARAGRLAEAVEAFDAVLAGRPDDRDAAANRALVAALIAGREALPPEGTIDGGAALTEKKSRAGEARSEGDEQPSGGDGMAGDQQAASSSSAEGGSRVARKGATDTKAQAAGEGRATGAATDSDGVGKASVTDAVIAKAFEDVRKREMGKSFDAQAMAANREWLETLADDPGRYLKLIIAAEQTRRREAGPIPTELDVLSGKATR